MQSLTVIVLTDQKALFRIQKQRMLFCVLEVCKPNLSLPKTSGN